MKFTFLITYNIFKSMVTTPENNPAVINMFMSESSGREGIN